MEEELVESDGPAKKMKRFFSPELKLEVISMLKIAVPIGITSLLHFSIMTESVIMCGHLSAAALEAVGLANSMLNAFGLGINVGVITACDTLFSQCSGSNDKKRTGMFLQRSLMFCTLHPLLLGIFYMFIEPIFIALGQDPIVADKAAFFLQLSIPGVFFNAEYYVLIRYMQSQDHVYPPIAIAFFGNLFNVVAQYLAIFQFGFDYEASAICQSLTYFFQFLSALLYIVISKFYKPTWDGWKMESLFDWKGFASLAIAGVGHLCLEIICYEGCTFLAGIMGVVELGAQSILFQTEAVIYMIPVSIGIAVNIRVGQSLGANKPNLATLAMRSGILISFVSAVVLGASLLALKDVIPKLFTTDSAVLAVAMNAFPVISFVVVMNHFLAIMNGMLRGCGRQKIGAYIVVLCYNVIAFPISIVMTFFSDFGVLGLWLGIVIGLTICFVLLIIVTCLQSMEKQAENAQERINIKYRSRLETSSFCRLENPSEDTLIQSYNSSGSYGCWTDVSELTAISHEEFVRVAIQKITLIVLVVCAFIVAICIHLYFPFHYINQELLHNSTILNSTLAPSREYSTVIQLK